MTARRAVRLPKDLFTNGRYTNVSACAIALLGFLDHSAHDLSKHQPDDGSGFVWLVGACGKPWELHSFFFGAKSSDPELVRGAIAELVALGHLQARADGAYGFSTKGSTAESERLRKDRERQRRRRAELKKAQLELLGADTARTTEVVRATSAPGSVRDPGADPLQTTDVVRADTGADKAPDQCVVSTDPALEAADTVRTRSVPQRGHFSSSDLIVPFEQNDQRKRVSAARVLELWTTICRDRLVETGQEPPEPKLWMAASLDWHIQDDPTRADEGLWIELFTSIRDNTWMWWGKKDIATGAIVPVALDWVLNTFRHGEGLTNLKAYEIGRYNKREKPKRAPRSQTAEPEIELEPKSDPREAIAALRAKGDEFSLIAARRMEARLAESAA